MGSDGRLTLGLRDDLITAELAEALELRTSDRVDDAPLARSEAIERLGRHLLWVARRLRSPTTDEELVSSAELVNTAIDALGEEFDGDQVSTPVRVLRGVRHSEGLAAATLPAHLTIPLTTSELMVNGAGSLPSVPSSRRSCVAPTRST